MSTVEQRAETSLTPVHAPDHDEHGTNTGVSNGKLAMWLFLSSDCLFFGAFISTYLLYRGKSGQEGPGRPSSSTSPSRRSPRSSC